MREPGSHMRSTCYERTLGPARVARPRVARVAVFYTIRPPEAQIGLSLIHISEPTRQAEAAATAQALGAAEGDHVALTPLGASGVPAAFRKWDPHVRTGA